jgi:hypothetical protein
MFQIILNQEMSIKSPVNGQVFLLASLFFPPSIILQVFRLKNEGLPSSGGAKGDQG